ncbi:hypothetical protein L1049_026533 [Liquidambar formosana]|uniref:DNA polymerase III subunit gamma/tau helical lid domain-containing protein n=1 Tax=Liquidambar formosana TaxID=63359 RepID=A0AAP0R6I0_LIQFO
MATRDPVQSQSQNNTAKTTARSNNHVNDTDDMRKQVKNSRQTSSSLIVGCPDHSRQDLSPVRGEIHWGSSLYLPAAEFRDAASFAMATEQSFEPGGESLSLQSSLTLSTSQIQEEKEKNNTSQKSQQNGCTVPWRWSRIHKGIRRRTVISLMGRRSTKGNNQKPASKAKSSRRQIFSFKEHSRKEIDHVSQDNFCDSGFHSAYLSGQNSQQNDRDQRSHTKDEHRSTTSISHKYQPKLFQDIAGHEIIIKAISNAVQKEQVAHLYLFYGPSGTGKTSTAIIFTMALNCESTSHDKPCWSCRGCSRSLSIMELCYGSRNTGFKRIRTLLQSTSFTQAVPGFKVLIIEECHSLTAEAWDEILGIVEGVYGSSVIFVLITVDANKVPRTISSRCQKFFFPKLQDIDITLRLARIVALEDIAIEREALKLIVAKADGSLREAENILDQLALLGPRITSSMVQQLVGGPFLTLFFSHFFSSSFFSQIFFGLKAKVTSPVLLQNLLNKMTLPTN